MILPILQLIACITLAIVAFRWRFLHSAGGSAYRTLVPFISAAGIFGVILVFPYIMEVFVVYYSGAQYELEAMLYRFNGPYWWVYYAGLILPLLPILGLFPFIGKRPTMVVAISFLALIPVSFTPAVTVIKRITTKVESTSTELPTPAGIRN